jgi:fatty acid desaturase
LFRPLTKNSDVSPALLDRTIGGLLNDPRDVPFVKLTISATLVVIPFAAMLYAPGVFRWWLALVYLAVNFAVFLDRFILMLHNTSHRALFKPRLRWLNSYIPWVLGPFFGETPETYFAHHVGMHHPENNLAADLSSTMEFQRDRVSDFARYYGRFMFRGLPDLAKYLGQKNRTRLRARMLAGELLFIATAVGLAYVNWRATLVVFFIPVVAVRFLMMAGNWGQHAFVAADAPESAFKNSITCLAARYNRRCFNDGYHIGHHVKANRHWSEMPADFENNRALYAREGAIVFEGIDFFAVWALLMFQRYASLARHYVVLDGARPSEEEIIALLRSRTRAFAVATPR